MDKPNLPRTVPSAFEKTIRRRGLVKKGDRVLVAFSGGLDSSALLALFLEIKDSWSLDIQMAHFNHRLRPGAAADVRFARQTARRLGLRLHLGAADVAGHARRRGLNLEEAARTLRYEFLRKTADRIRAARIATGHTLSDQAETLLIRLLRGSGPTGLAGIHPERDGVIIRPLIEVEHAELEAYLKHKGWTFREDESNRDLRLVRNRIRHELLPLLQRSYEPRVVEHLGHAADILLEEDRFIEELAGRETKRAVCRDKGRLSLDLAAVRSQPTGLARRVVRSFLREIKGDLRSISYLGVNSVLALGKSKDLVLAPNLILCREGDRVFKKQGPPARPKYDFLWDGKGILDIPPASLGLRSRRVAGAKVRSLDYDDERRAYCDRAKLTLPLRVRNRREGDRYRPLGAPGAKKLKEILRAKGIPPSERDRRPVVISGERIVWMPGLAVAEDFKVGPGTAQVLVLETIERL